MDDTWGRCTSLMSVSSEDFNDSRILSLPEGFSAIFSWFPAEKIPQDAKDLRSIVYILQSPSGKQYVGITQKTFRERSYAYKNIDVDNSYCYGQVALRNAIIKYGWTNFSAGILHISDSNDNIEDLGAAERYFIRKLGTMTRGYNSTSGGESAGGGGTVSEETRGKISSNTKRYWEDQDKRDRHSERLQELWKTNQEFANSALGAIKRRWEIPGEREKRSDGLREMWSDEEYREKMSAMSRKNWTNDDYRDTIIESLKARWTDESYRENMISAISKKANERWNNAAWKQKRLEDIKKETLTKFEFAYFVIEDDKESRVILSEILPDKKLYARAMNHFHRRGNDVPWIYGDITLLRKKNPLYGGTLKK
jgi:group I intron endonuclease